MLINGCLQGVGQYTNSIKSLETDIQECLKRVNELSGIKESDTGLAAPALWDLAADKQALQSKITFIRPTIHCFGISSNNFPAGYLFISLYKLV